MGRTVDGTGWTATIDLESQKLLPFRLFGQLTCLGWSGVLLTYSRFHHFRRQLDRTLFFMLQVVVAAK